LGMRIARRTSIDDVVISGTALLCDRSAIDRQSRTIIARLSADHLCAA
jgi:hypothetical protein